jgi:PAS domain-containing protein
MTKEKLLQKIKELEEKNKILENQLSSFKSKEETDVDVFLNSAPGYAFVKDKNLNYLGANQSFCDLLKITCDTLKGKTDYDLFPEDLAKKYIKDDKKVLDTGKALFVEEITIDARSSGKRS